MADNNSRQQQQRRQSRRPRGRREQAAQSEFFEKVIRINRICKTVAGGRRLRFNALIVVGDRKGRVGIGLAKSQEVAMAIDKARKKAYRDMREVKVDGHTIPIEVNTKFKAVRILLRPARKGRGIVAGQTLRAMAEAAGIKDLVTKVIGSGNPVNIAQAGMNAFVRISEMEILGRDSSVGPTDVKPVPEKTGETADDSPAVASPEAPVPAVKTGDEEAPAAGVAGIPA